MPVLEIDEIQKLVDEGRLGAVTLDTNVFHRLGYNLEATILREIAQFPRHGVRHVVTDVVAGEIRAHMIAAAEEARSRLRGALRGLGMARGWPKAERERVARDIGLYEDAEVAVYRRWLDFISETTAELLHGTPADGETLVEMYFAGTPPFEQRADKKHEFPDAVALLTLEAAGEAMGKHVLAITDDRGWAGFASTARWVATCGDVAEAISLLHAADEIAGERALMLLADDDACLRDDIDAAIGLFFEDYHPLIEARSHLDFMAEFEHARITAIHPVEPPSAKVLSSDPDTVTLAFDAPVDVDVRARFSFWLHDGTDREYLEMGETSATRPVNLLLPVTVVVLRGSTAQDGAVSVEIQEARQPVVDFGVVEPSRWRGREVG